MAENKLRIIGFITYEVNYPPSSFVYYHPIKA